MLHSLKLHSACTKPVTIETGNVVVLYCAPLMCAVWDCGEHQGSGEGVPTSQKPHCEYNTYIGMHMQ